MAKKKKKSEPDKPLSFRERRAAAKKKRKKQEAKAAKKRAQNSAARTERVVGEASEPLRGGKDGARLFDVKPDEGKLNDWNKIKTPKEKADAARRKNAEWGRQVGQGQVQADAINEKIAREKASRRAAQSASEQAEMRSREDYRKSAARKNTREYKRGQHLLKDPGREERLAKFRGRKARGEAHRAVAKNLAETAPQGATRGADGAYETKRQRAARKGNATKVRRNAMRKKYAAKEPSPVSKTARQRARDINTMNRSEPKNTGNIYADKDLAHEKKRISSKPTNRPPGGASNEEYKRVAKNGLKAKYGKASKVSRAAKNVARIGTKAIPGVGAAAVAADVALATKATHDRQKGRKRWFDSPEGKNYKKYHKNRKDASAKKFAKTGKPNMKYTQAWDKKSNAPRYPSRSEFEAMGRAKTGPKRRPKPKKKYNRKDTWG